LAVQEFKMSSGWFSVAGRAKEAQSDKNAVVSNEVLPDEVLEAHAAARHEAAMNAARQLVARVNGLKSAEHLANAVGARATQAPVYFDSDSLADTVLNGGMVALGCVRHGECAAARFQGMVG
jgi:hypothetical protein